MSNKTKWTPGPWSASEWATEYTVSSDPCHYSVCHLEGCNNDAANARLIAAAPEMAALLEDLAAHPNNVAWRGDEIRALLAKIKKGA